MAYRNGMPANYLSPTYKPLRGFQPSYTYAPYIPVYSTPNVKPSRLRFMTNIQIMVPLVWCSIELTKWTVEQNRASYQSPDSAYKSIWEDAALEILNKHVKQSKKHIRALIKPILSHDIYNPKTKPVVVAFGRNLTLVYLPFTSTLLMTRATGGGSSHILQVVSDGQKDEYIKRINNSIDDAVCAEDCGMPITELHISVTSKAKGAIKREKAKRL